MTPPASLLDSTSASPMIAPMHDPARSAVVQPPKPLGNCHRECSHGERRRMARTVLRATHTHGDVLPASTNCTTDKQQTSSRGRTSTRPSPARRWAQRRSSPRSLPSRTSELRFVGCSARNSRKHTHTSQAHVLADGRDPVAVHGQAEFRQAAPVRKVSRQRWVNMSTCSRRLVADEQGQGADGHRCAAYGPHGQR
jgi:hypothetical protein